MTPNTVTEQDAEKVIIDAIASVGPEHDQIKRDSTFESLDVDSLDVVEVAQVVEEELGVEIKGDDAKDLKTVGDVIDLVVARAS